MILFIFAKATDGIRPATSTTVNDCDPEISPDGVRVPGFPYVGCLLEVPKDVKIVIALLFMRPLQVGLCVEADGVLKRLSRQAVTAHLGSFFAAFPSPQVVFD